MPISKRYCDDHNQHFLGPAYRKPLVDTTTTIARLLCPHFGDKFGFLSLGGVSSQVFIVADIRLCTEYLWPSSFGPCTV